MPLWDWFIPNHAPTTLVKAIHMDKDFTYETVCGIMRGHAGDWLVEEKNGLWQQALSDDFFKQNFTENVPERPEMVQPPDPAPEPLAPEVEPPTG